MLYATSRRFLEVFGLNSLEDLPTLRDLEELATDVNGAVDPARADADPSPPEDESRLPDPDSAGELH
jgi:hypothetical protein